MKEKKENEKENCISIISLCTWNVPGDRMWKQCKGCLHVPLVICGGPFKGGREVTELVSTESIPKTLLALAGVDVGDKMIGENLLDVVEKKNHYNRSV